MRGDSGSGYWKAGLLWKSALTYHVWATPLYCFKGKELSEAVFFSGWSAEIGLDLRWHRDRGLRVRVTETERVKLNSSARAVIPSHAKGSNPKPILVNDG